MFFLPLDLRPPGIPDVNYSPTREQTLSPSDPLVKLHALKLWA